MFAEHSSAGSRQNIVEPFAGELHAAQLPVFEMGTNLMKEIFWEGLYIRYFIDVFLLSTHMLHSATKEFLNDS